MTNINWDWPTLAVLALNTLGWTEWIKGFTIKAAGSIHGNILRIIQVGVAFALAAIAIYLPPVVLYAMTVIACTTLYKTDIMTFGQNLFAGLAKGKSDSVKKEDA